MATKPRLIVNIREKDLGMAHFLREAAKIRKNPYVKVGVTQAKGSKVREDGKKTTADIANIHEFGAPDAGIPERSFIRSTVAKNQEKYDAHIAQLRDKIFDANEDMTVEKALGLIGQEVTADIKNTIRKNEAGMGGPTPLKASTVRHKNAGAIGKAESRVRGFEAKAKLSKGDKGKLFAAQELIDTGGSSTPLIDTSQLVNSIGYELSLNGEGAGSREYEGEGPKAY